MILVLFTAAGCSRCAIAKNFLRGKGLAYEEHDAVGQGKEVFAAFYRAHREHVRRWKDGVEFPVLVDGAVVRQGVAAAAAWLEAGERLDGCFVPGEPVKGWVCADASGGEPGVVEDLVRVLGFLKSSGLKIEVRTAGRRPDVLQRLLDAGLGDRVVMEVTPPPARCAGDPAPAEIGRSMAVTARFADHRFETTVVPFFQAGADAAAAPVYPAPAEIAAAARWIAEATGSPKQPYVLRPFDPSASADGRLRAVEPLPPDALVRCRSAARRYQVLTEIEKPA